MITALVVAAILGQENGNDGLWKFKPGTAWVYQETQEESAGKEKKVKKKRVENTVLKEADGRTVIESKEYKNDEKEVSKTKTVFSYVEDGYVTWGREVEGKLQPQIRLFKVGAKKGDSWKSEFGKGEKQELTFVGTEELTVAAGTYKEAIHVQMKFGDAKAKGTADFYLVDGVGMVKGEMALGEMMHNVIELQSYTPAR